MIQRESGVLRWVDQDNTGLYSTLGGMDLLRGGGSTSKGGSSCEIDSAFAGLAAYRRDADNRGGIP